MEGKYMCEPDEISLIACFRISTVGLIANQAVMALTADGVSGYDRDGALPYCFQNALGVRGMKKKGGKDAH